MLWLYAKASQSCHPTDWIMIMFYITMIMILVILLDIYVLGYIEWALTCKCTKKATCRPNVSADGGEPFIDACQDLEAAC